MHEDWFRRPGPGAPTFPDLSVCGSHDLSGGEFPGFIDFKSRSRPSKQADDADRADDGSTPREAVSTAVDGANAAVAAEVLDRVRQCEPAFLEQLVLAILTAMGTTERRSTWGSQARGSGQRDPSGPPRAGSDLRAGEAVRGWR
jgi:hypothetical protein